MEKGRMLHRLSSATIAAIIATCSLSCTKETTSTTDEPATVEITVTEVSDTYVRYSVSVLPETTTYLCGVIPYSEFSSSSDFIGSVLSGIREEAIAEGKEESSYLSGMLKTGVSELMEENLSASEKYVAYAAGVNSDYSVTTETVFKEFTTEEPKAPKVFSFSPVVTGLSANITVTPLDNEMQYFYVTADKSVIDWQYGGLENLNEGYESEFLSDIEDLVNYVYHNYPDAVASVCWTGEQTFPKTRLIPDTDYYMMAAGINPATGELSTDVYYDIFHTEKGGDLSTFSIKFNIGPVENGNRVKITTEPSAGNVRYYFDKTVPGKTEDEIISDLYDDLINVYIQNGIIADANGYYNTWCSVGPGEFTYTNLSEGTHIIYGFGIDNDGNVATDIMFSDEFTIGSPDGTQAK